MTDNNEHKPLDEILPSAAPAEPEPTADVPAAPESNAEPAEDRGGNWSYRALKDERSKRQALAQRVAELEAERAQWGQQQEQTQRDQFWQDPDSEIQRLQDTTRKAVERASKAEVIAEHGRAEFAAMEKAINQAIQANDPDMYVLRDICLTSDDPHGACMAWYQQRKGGQNDQPPAQEFPSNLATARNVGGRNQPWGGPKPLQDIFDRRNAK